jgi:hypothetical protein
MTAAYVLAIGFLLGLKHATEADHVTAVATLVTGQRSLPQIIRQGIAWGLGHSLTLLGIGGMVMLLGQAIPTHLAQALECAVGVMLVILGADVLCRVLRVRGSPSKHVHTSATHAAHRTGAEGRAPWRALLVGMVHGMAGSAALIVLSLGAMRSAGLALAYILIFGIGSVAGMAAMSAVMAYPLRLSAQRLGAAHQLVTAFIGAFSCVFGALVVYRIGLAT